MVSLPNESVVENQKATRGQDRSSPAVRDGRPEAWRESQGGECRRAAGLPLLRAVGAAHALLFS